MHNGPEHYTRIWIDAAITDTSDIYCILQRHTGGTWYKAPCFHLAIQNRNSTIARRVRQLLILIFAAPAQPREGYHWACLWGTPGKHPSNLLTTTKKTRQAPPRPLQQLPLYPQQQVPPLGEFFSYIALLCWNLFRYKILRKKKKNNRNHRE